MNSNFPYSTTALNAAPELKMDVKVQVQKYKQEEEMHQAPQVMPHTLNQAAIEIIGNVFEKMLALRNLFSATEFEPNSDNQVIKEIIEDIDKICIKLEIEIPEKVDKLRL